MSRTRIVSSLAAALVLAAASKASALWIETQLTPKSLQYQRLTFEVKTKEVGNLRQVEVTFAPRSGKLPPFTRGQLALIVADTYVGDVPLEETRASGTVTYWFRLSPASLAQTKFEFSEQNFVDSSEVKSSGKPQPRAKPMEEQIMGGSTYWFYLRDFVETPGP